MTFYHNTNNNKPTTTEDDDDDPRRPSLAIIIIADVGTCELGRQAHLHDLADCGLLLFIYDLMLSRIVQAQIK